MANGSLAERLGQAIGEIRGLRDLIEQLMKRKDLDLQSIATLKEQVRQLETSVEKLKAWRAEVDEAEKEDLKKQNMGLLKLVGLLAGAGGLGAGGLELIKWLAKLALASG